MSAFFDALPSNVATPEAQRMIFERVVSNPAELRWTPITLQDARGNVLVCEVTFDAIKIEGVRVNVSADTLQRIADEVDGLLLTPLLCDRIWEQSTLKIPPVTRKITSAKVSMIDQSRDVDRLIANRSGNPCDIGKDWVLTDKLLRTPTFQKVILADGSTGTRIGFPMVACNYGWHIQAGAKTESSVDGLERVIQGVGLAHDRSHTDYSQTARLVRSQAQLNGRPFPMAEVYTSVDFAPMVSHEGPLRLTAQPISAVAAWSNLPGGAGSAATSPKGRSAAPLVAGAAGAVVGGLSGGPVGVLVGGAAGLLIGTAVAK
jgi:hypothetical protein